MTTIHSILRAATLAAGLAATASAQYSQPVKEVEKEARAAVNGFCHITWPANTVGSGACFLKPVPAGKILAVRTISARCSSRAGNVSEVKFGGPSNSPGEYLPLQGQAYDGYGEAVRLGQASSFIHVRGSQDSQTGLYVFAQRNSHAGADYGATCEMTFQGFLLDAQ